MKLCSTHRGPRLSSDARLSMTKTQELDVGRLRALLSEDTFLPSEPQSLKETGLSESYVEGLTCKLLLSNGTVNGRNVADCLCLPFAIIDRLLATLRTRQWVTHAGAAPLNDYYYTLTQEGSRHAHAYQAACSYCGPAPVPLMDYVISVEAQAISAEPIGAIAWNRRYAAFPSITSCLRSWVRRSTPPPGCFSTGRPATANPLSTAGSRCVSARPFGCHMRSLKTAS